MYLQGFRLSLWFPCFLHFKVCVSNYKVCILNNYAGSGICLKEGWYNFLSKKGAIQSKVILPIIRFKKMGFECIELKPPRYCTFHLFFWKAQLWALKPANYVHVLRCNFCFMKSVLKAQLFILDWFFRLVAVLLEIQLFSELSVYLFIWGLRPRCLSFITVLF